MGIDHKHGNAQNQARGGFLGNAHFLGGGEMSMSAPCVSLGSWRGWKREGKSKGNGALESYAKRMVVCVFGCEGLALQASIKAQWRSLTHK